MPKAVKSDTVYNDQKGNNKTTYDKLWLFSLKEGSLRTYRDNEGEMYRRKWTELGWEYNIYRENGTSTATWLRSLSLDEQDEVYVMLNTSVSMPSDFTGAFSPGFCIP